MFIAMNRFQVNRGKEGDFEAMWRNRETYLDQVPGFLAFSLLRNSSPAEDGPVEYISHSTWQSRQAFEAWRDSESFNRGHAQGSVAGILAGHPEVTLYDTVLHQTKSAVQA